MKWTNMNEWNFAPIPEISGIFRIFLAFFSKSRDILSFPDHFCEIPANFHQNFAEKSQNPSKNANEMKWIFFIPPKNLTIFCWNFEIWAVQKYENLVGTFGFLFFSFFLRAHVWSQNFSKKNRQNFWRNEKISFHSRFSMDFAIFRRNFDEIRREKKERSRNFTETVTKW